MDKSMHPLKEERKKRNLTQKELAKRLRLSARTVWCAENNVPIGLDSRRRICAYFKKSSEELGLIGEECQANEQLDETPPSQQVTELPSNEPERQHTLVPSTSPLKEVTPGAIMAYTITISSSLPELDILGIIHSRRKFLESIFNTACTTLVLSPYTLLDEENKERLEKALIRPSRVDETILGDLSAITRSHWRLCMNASIDILSGVAGHFTTVMQLLKYPHTTPIHLQLCSLIGECALILGKTLHDIREYQLAWAYYSFSLKAAQEAKNSDLWAVGLGRMALLLIYCEKPQSAFCLIQDAQQGDIQSIRIRGWLAVIEAEIAAHLANPDRCLRSLAVSKNLMASSQLGDDSYFTGYNLSRQWGYEGACYVRLRQPDEALPALQQAYTLLEPTALRSCSTLLIDIGAVYAQLGALDEACRHLLQALEITKQTKSLNTLQRMYTARRELGSGNNTAEVKSLDEQISDALTFFVGMKETQ